MSEQSTSSGSKSPISIALIIGVVGAAVGLFGVYQGYSDGESRNLFSWLMGLAFWMSIAIGMLFMILLFHIFKASWPIIIRRQLEHGMVAFPVLAVLFLPLIFIAHSDEDMPSDDHHVHHEESSSYPDVEHLKDGAHGDSAEAGKHGDANAHDDHGHGSIAKKSGLLWKWMALDGTNHHDILLTKKEAYLNKGAFTVRFFLYFAVSH